jgi:aminocarboxymuconate-semialdehyde decarboxylase
MARRAENNDDALVELFLDMQAAERGAGANTLAAYRNDLEDLSAYLRASSKSVARATTDDLRGFLKSLDERGFAASSLARRLSAVFNDDLVAAHERYPDRLFGLAMLPVHHAGEALGEIERIARAPGIRGIYMGTCIGDMDLSDPSLFPVYEALEAAGLPIFLHPLKVIGMEDRLKPFFLSNLLGNPFDTAVAAAHLIFGGVLDRFPKLDFVLPHAGGALPFLIGRLQHGWTVRPELAHMEAGPETYLGRFYYDTVAHSDDALAYLIQKVGPQRVLLGSDYCFDMGYERPVEVVEKQVQLSADEREAIFSANAARLLRL